MIGHLQHDFAERYLTLFVIEYLIWEIRSPLEEFGEVVLHIKRRYQLSLTYVVEIFAFQILVLAYEGTESFEMESH